MTSKRGTSRNAAVILSANPSATRSQAGAEPVPARARSMLIPAGQAQHDGPHHGGVGLEGAAIANRERKDGEGRHSQKGHERAFAPACQHEKPEGRQGAGQRRENSAGFFEAQAGRSLQDDDGRLVDRRLDEEVIGKGRGVELRPQETRSAIEVARHHRRRNLAADIIFDDRLTSVQGPDQERRQQQECEQPARSQSADSGMQSCQNTMFPEMHAPQKNDLHRRKNNVTMIQRHPSLSQVESVGR